jgi:tellurite resistance protein TehA-like permease/glutaredoxin
MMADPEMQKILNEIDVDDYIASPLAEATDATVEVDPMESPSTSSKELTPLDPVVEVTDLSHYQGSNLGERVESFLHQHAVAVIAKSFCPFCRDVLDVLAKQLGVTVHVINIDKINKGGEIHRHVVDTYKHKTVPAVFCRGTFLGGCDDVKALRATGKLEREILAGLIGTRRATYSGKVETAHLVPVQRSQAIHPMFWFPNTVNNYVVRVTGFQVCIAAVVSAAFPNEDFAGYISVSLLIDFVLRMIAGSSVSPLGMVATLVTSPFRPQFKPGPPKQFAAFCGTFFSLMGTIFYFVDFEGHQYVACAFMAGLAGASGLEWSLDFCLGCLFYSWGIQFGIFPDYVYRIYTSSKQEVEESWDYMYTKSNAPVPTKVNTDPTSAISLKYKKKTDDWTKDDFDIVRHMQIAYFVMPLALLTLSVAFKMGGDFPENFNTTGTLRQYVIPDEVYIATGILGGIVFALWAALYLARLILHPHKCKTEWDCPLRSPSFGAPTICLMCIAFLLFDEVDDYDLVPRIVFWVASIVHSLMTIAKLGEWIGLRHELEHVHSQWMILPVGLSVAALIAPIVPFFDVESENSAGNVLVARLFQSFAVVMWIVLFAINFLKVVTTHNSDNRLRHGVFIWVAAPCVIGLADFSICAAEQVVPLPQCTGAFMNYFFMALFIFATLCWTALPYIAFLGSEKFGMQYWIGCFALDAMAACAALMYAIYGYKSLETLMLIAFILASTANFVCFMHTLAFISRRRVIFTPEQKWGPLSFMKLTHEAVRGNMATMQSAVDTLDLNDTSDAARDHLAMFAAHFNRLCIVHDEHSKHEDEVIFKEFNNWFSKHAKEYNDDHEDFHAKIAHFKDVANSLLNTSLPLQRRQFALDTFKRELPPFLDYFMDHLKGEEDNLNPIGRKYLPLKVQKEISRKVFEMTSVENWEVIIPYVVNNLPRHDQRVRYLKVLFWGMPERGQQIGAMVYRNVDAVMWERLRVEVPEMIPRGSYNWRRYY